MHVVVRSMFVLIFFSFKWPVLCHLINRSSFTSNHRLQITYYSSKLKKKSKKLGSAREEMASMMGGDFVEAYVLKNAYKEKLRRMDKAAAAEGKSGKQDGSAGEKKAAAGASSRGGFFVLMKKKVHPKAAAGIEPAASSS